MKIETGIQERLSHEQLIWEYIDGTLEKVHSQQLEAMCFLLRAQNRCGVDISISIYFAAQGHWLSATTQGTSEEMDEILKIGNYHFGATNNIRNFKPTGVWS